MINPPACAGDTLLKERRKIMNQTTQDVIKFLNQPDLDFGNNATDAELLGHPEILHQRVHDLLQDCPDCFTSQDEGMDLLTRLNEADWPCVAEEFQTRLKLAAGFFGRDIGDAPSTAG